LNSARGGVAGAGEEVGVDPRKRAGLKRRRAASSATTGLAVPSLRCQALMNVQPREVFDPGRNRPASSGVTFLVHGPFALGFFAQVGDAETYAGPAFERRMQDALSGLIRKTHGHDGDIAHPVEPHRRVRTDLA